MRINKLQKYQYGIKQQLSVFGVESSLFWFLYVVLHSYLDSRPASQRGEQARMTVYET